MLPTLLSEDEVLLSEEEALAHKLELPEDEEAYLLLEE